MRLICDDIIKDYNIPVANILYINFEDERLIDFTVKDFESLYEIFIELENPKGRKFFFLDEILKNNDSSLLEQYFKDIIYRDIIARYSIRNVKEIKELTLYLASNPGTIQSYKKLKSLIGLKSENTVKSYLEALNNVFLFFYIDLFDFSIKKQIYNPSKIYCIDTALSRSISFEFSKNIGHLLENLVFLELKRENLEIFYWKSKKGNEVDFITRKGIKVDRAIQVTLSLEDERVKQREIKGLLEAKKELEPLQYLILTKDEEGTEVVEDISIEITPLWKWLALGN